MTPQQIINKVNEEASARFDEVIERVFSTVRNRHTHRSWTGECYCDYCRFIRGEYVDAKMALHAINKKLRFYEWTCTDTEVKTMDRLYIRLHEQVVKIHMLKQQKKALKEEVL